jgi:PAS domain S-box-containing protein
MIRPASGTQRKNVPECRILRICRETWLRAAVSPLTGGRPGLAVFVRHVRCLRLARFLLQGATAVSLALALALGSASPAAASCEAPLDDALLRPLDDLTNTDPISAVAGAERRLAAVAAPDALRRAQLYMIEAEAYAAVDNDPASAAAILAARRALAGAPAGSDTRQVRLRLTLIEAEGLQTRSELESGVATLNAIEPTVPEQSLDHACLLLARSRVEGRLAHQDVAARAAVGAYRIARTLGAADAAAIAAFELATTYRRAGLYADAIRMVDEAVDHARSAGHTAALANDLWEKARILGDGGDYRQALDVLDESTALSARLRDDTGIAFDAMERCNELIGLQRIEEAERSCHSADEKFGALGRGDQQLITRYHLIRIDVARGRWQSALARLDAALGAERDQVPPRIVADLYAARSDVLAELGHDHDALRDSRQATAIREHDQLLQRSLAAAALGAQLQIERIDEDRQALERTVGLERELGARRTTVMRLSLAALAVSLALSVSLAFLLWLRVRHQRDMRRAAESLETHARVIDTLREGVILADEAGRIEYANPALQGILGQDPQTLVGQGVDVLGIALPAADVTHLPTAMSDGRRREVQLTRASGDVVLLVTESTLALSGRSLRIFVLQDFTERRRLEMEVLESASAERDRLSNDLHDGLGQELTGISLLLKSALSGRQPDRETLDAVLQHLNEAIGHTRALAHSLAPVQIAGGALDVALQRLAQEVSRAWQVRVSCNGSLGHHRLEAVEADHLYRIAQEGITNAMRHSGCRTIQVAFGVSDGRVHLSVTDDGAGFDPERSDGDGLGLRMIAYRARLLGGSVEMEQPAAGGTRVSVRAPLQALDT